jgi:hypothetical protein
MATLHFKARAKATPEQFVAALTDFGPGRAELFPNSTDDELKVHSQGRRRPTSPRARKGSGSAFTTTGLIPTAWS